MSTNSPLGNNYGWVTNNDHGYLPRDLTQDMHDVLAVSALAQDLEVRKLEKTLGYKIVLGVLIGRTTIDLRIYKYDRIMKKPDHLASRMDGRDNRTYMEFNLNGGLDIVEGIPRENAQCSAPEFYAVRRLSPLRMAEVDAMQFQFSGLPVLSKVGVPRAGAPLKEEEWTEDEGPEPPTLEPAHDHTR